MKVMFVVSDVSDICPYSSKQLELEIREWRDLESQYEDLTDGLLITALDEGMIKFHRAGLLHDRFGVQYLGSYILIEF